MAQSQVQARDEKPGKNMLWGGRFTGSFVRSFVEFSVLPGYVL